VARRQFGSHLDLESELLVGRQWLQRAADGLGNILDAVIRQFEYELTGLDLGQIESVIDEAEQVLALSLQPVCTENLDPGVMVMKSTQNRL
jgi:hypothetical protein